MIKALQVQGHYLPNAAQAMSMIAAQPCSHSKDLSAKGIPNMLCISCQSWCQETMITLHTVLHLGRPCCIRPLVALPNTKGAADATFQHILSVW